MVPKPTTKNKELKDKKTLFNRTIKNIFLLSINDCFKNFISSFIFILIFLSLFLKTKKFIEDIVKIMKKLKLSTLLSYQRNLIFVKYIIKVYKIKGKNKFIF